MLKRIGAEESGELKAIASGTLPSGKPVIVNADGTVSTISGLPASFGAQQEFESGSPEPLAAAYDITNNRLVVAFTDLNHSARGKAIVGTVNSDNTITFGSQATFKSSSSYSISLDFDTANGKFLIAYRSSSTVFARVATVNSSDNSISFGTEVTVQTSINTGFGHRTCVYDPDNGKFLVIYAKDNAKGLAKVGTISGTDVSFGSEAEYESSKSGTQQSMVYDTGSNKFVLAYLRSDGSTTDVAVRVATISGTSVSFGSDTQLINANISKHFGIAYDPVNNKTLAVYRDSGNSDYATLKVGTVSGTGISFGSAVVIDSGTGSFQHDAAYNTSTGTVDITYRADGSNSNVARFVSATISGTSATVTTPVSYTDGEANDFHLVYDPDNSKMIFNFRDHTTSQNGVSVVRQPNTLNLTSENYIGISKGGAVADTKGATVDIIGAVNDEQSGLTAGQQYFVQTDGTIGTTAATPSVLAGTAISATELLVKT
tara:strand:+ start:163 stop:1623 length:1461 start_codon:yes stop_codon:yes gene_type:complete